MRLAAGGALVAVEKQSRGTGQESKNLQSKKLTSLNKPQKRNRYIVIPWTF
jgi:hypothetical protein